VLRLLADENFNGDLEILLLASQPEELQAQIRFLPL
jgi:hypothetical protein